MPALRGCVVSGIPDNTDPQAAIRWLIGKCGLSGVLDRIADEVPELPGVVRDLHEIVEQVERYAEQLIGRRG